MSDPGSPLLWLVQVAGKAAAARKINDKKSTFAKFDVDRDGKLNKKEVEAYMKATINFDLPSAILDQIAACLQKDFDDLCWNDFGSEFTVKRCLPVSGSVNTDVCVCV